MDTDRGARVHLGGDSRQTSKELVLVLYGDSARRDERPLDVDGCGQRCASSLGRNFSTAEAAQLQTVCGDVL